MKEVAPRLDSSRKFNIRSTLLDFIRAIGLNIQIC